MDPAVGVSWPYFRYCSDILVEELNKSMKDLSKDSLGRECKALPVEPTYSVYIHVNLLTLVLAIQGPWDFWH
jgi:hypothetical protein